ncbi:MAG: hypothetical protein IKA65_01110 [Lentisphaeria bacterium]|nr:hypothetical protein [Lentisphaeria bacterium]
MKFLSSAMLCAAMSGILCAGNAHPQLDPGGINSVDMFKYSRNKTAEKSGTIRKNLLPRSQDHWNFVFNANRKTVVGGWNDEWKQKEAAMSRLVKTAKTIDQASGLVTFMLETPSTINQFRDERGRPLVHHRLLPVENLPVKPDTNYTFTYPLRGVLGHNSSFIVTVRYYNKKNKLCGRMQYFPAKITREWQEHTINFRTPENCAKIRLNFGINNIGKAEFRVGTLAEGRNNGYELCLFPMGVIDNIYAVAAGQINFLGFAQRVQNGKIPKHPQMILNLPAGIKLLEGSPWTKIKNIKQNPDGTTTVVANVRKFRWESLAVKEWTAVFPVQFVITSDLEPSDKLYEFTYQAISENNYASSLRKGYFKVIPAIKNEQPEIFKSGIYDSRNTLAGKKVFSQFAKQFKNQGFNCFFNFKSGDYVSESMNKLGIECYLGSSSIQNGYATNTLPQERPEYTHFIGVDGKPVADRNGSRPLMCPTTVIYRTEYYRKHILGEVRTRIKCSDYLMSNWEPQGPQSSGGCFCKNCKRDFIAYSKLPAADVNAVWPGEIISKYRNEWLAFKSNQHAQYLQTYNEDVDKIAKSMGKKGAGFMPMITRDLMLDSEFNLTDKNAFSVRFYASKIKWINPWGPYLAHHWDSFRRDLPGSRIRMLTMARSVVRFLDKVIQPGESRPNLLAFPNGLCIGMIVSPEQLAMDTLSIYVGNWQGSMPYYFPCNYDARYWKALSDCNTAIARTENVVMQGKKLSGVKKKILSDYPAPLYAEINAPSQPISSLDITAWKKNDRICVAVGNFWEYGEVFYKLSIPGLNANKRYKVYDAVTGTVFAGKDGNHYTGKSIADGILQHAGALRWVFIMIEPTTQIKAVGNVLVESEIAEVMKKRKAGIAAVAEKERQFIAANIAPVEVQCNVDSFKPFSNNGISVSVSKLKPAKKVIERTGAYNTGVVSSDNEERTIFTINGGSSRWIVEPDQGAFIASWLFNGKEFSHPGPKQGLAIDGPWLPTARFIHPFKFVKAGKTADGVVLEFQRILNSNDNKIYDRLVLHKRMEFSPDKVKVISTLSNPFSDTVRFAYRYHNTPGPMQYRKDQPSGVGKFYSGNGLVEFKRLNKHHYFKMQNSPLEKLIMNRLFGGSNIATYKDNGPTIQISRPQAEFVTADKKYSLCVSIAPEIDFNGFASWDAPDAITFEPVFNTRELPVGQSWSCEMTMEVRQNQIN